MVINAGVMSDTEESTAKVRFLSSCFALNKEIFSIPLQNIMKILGKEVYKETVLDVTNRQIRPPQSLVRKLRR